MKSYHEMVQWTVDKIEESSIKYREWVAIITIAETFGLSTETVSTDVKLEQEFRELVKKKQKRAKLYLEYEQSRLANIAKDQK